MKYQSKVKAQFSLKLSLPLRMLLPILIFTTIHCTVQAQKDWKLSGSVGLGHAPSMTYDGLEGTGQLLIFSGDLEYKKIIGRLQYSPLIKNSYKGDFENQLKTNFSFHGSLGYNATVTEKLHVPIMLSAGGSLLTYNFSLSGVGGDTFTEGSPQGGITISPYYLITNKLSVQTMLRYHKGFKTDEKHEPIDIIDLSIGLRLTL